MLPESCPHAEWQEAFKEHRAGYADDCLPGDHEGWVCNFPGDCYTVGCPLSVSLGDQYERQSY